MINLEECRSCMITCTYMHSAYCSIVHELSLYLWHQDQVYRGHACKVVKGVYCHGGWPRLNDYPENTVAIVELHARHFLSRELMI